MTNPLLETWKTPHGLPPFDLIEDADFEPAFEVALAQARANIEAISLSANPPSFVNTIEALERAEEKLNRVLGVFYSVAGADSTDKREDLMRVFGPQLAAFGSEVSSNKALFGRIEDLWARRESLGLNAEQMRVLTLTRRGFVRAGAQLEGKKAERLKEIMQRLSVLGTEFTQNLLAAERSWFMELEEEDLVGLPDFVVAAARAAGEEKGCQGPVITTSRSLITPFLAFSPRRDLREKAFAAWVSRGEGDGSADNRLIARETLALREERARLLGYDSFAAFKLETEMAGGPEAVRDMLMAVWEPARAAALEDQDVLTERLRADGINGPLEAWDWHYYSEARRREEHDLDEAELKSYFQLERMIEAAFDCANRLFGLEFAAMDAPLYHPDARAWEVTRDGRLMAVFVADYFARGSKRSGAWCGAMRSQQKLAGDIRPIVTNVCNFAKPAEGQPALLSWDDARTLFHEFGHALHHILSDVTYESVSGTSVARDFVELPSQLFEHWLEVPEVLERFATHAQTGEAMPADLLKRLLAASSYNTGFQTVEYTASALVDLDFHDGAAPEDPMAAQAATLARIGMPEAIRMRHATPHFAHVFAGDGYSSGYYSYMWSEVMDADAFAAFKEAGGAFDAATAERLETHILSRGGSVDAKELYLAFRGKMPGVEALLKGRGLA
ncbi:M3 family metallopeptidase [Aliiroseovarius crassostreae]|uniref:M3 family metallopeptidase n=1 Tax=Aliiroseovarius crassostreae TaxID=154981 RepID=UPI00220ADC31|nr:M3 family metallopeptidase [Aliiroseovarius crassostreae]UWP92702.1 M3 family metallopeptidase [Aliiroseovarius crassostreae]